MIRSVRLAAATAALTVWPAVPAAAQAIVWSGIGYELGSADAPVVVVEFGDFGCNSCAQFAAETFGHVLAGYVETGKVRWRFVPFDIGSFPNSAEAAMAAECAARQDRLWPMHDLLFERQDEWMKERRVERRLAAYAAELGLDARAFAGCYDSKTAKQKVKRANAAAKELRVRATPTFFIDGERVQGALPASLFREVLDRRLAATDVN